MGKKTIATTQEAMAQRQAEEQEKENASSEAAPPSQARCTESSDSDDIDEMPSLEDDDRGTIALAARADTAPEVPETALEDNQTAPAPAPANGEDAMPTREECVEAIRTIATEFKCPIGHDLPIDPVMAKDGVVYERAAIERWFRTKEGERRGGDPTSPSTRAVIGTELIPVPQIRNTIEALVKSGAIDGELATAWKQKLATALKQKLVDETKVKEMRTRAEGGDEDAMYRLGGWYQFGMNGLAVDEAQARAWLERSASARNPKGMACFGRVLLRGIGGPKDNVFGMMNVTEAAHLGSDVGAYWFGGWFLKGDLGLPKDPARARYWLKKVVDRECELRAQEGHEDRADAARWLHELDGGDDALYARLQRRHEEHQRRQREATALRE